MSKAICMAITAWYAKEETLVTLGDAIASFLDDPDPTTAGLCLSSRKDIPNELLGAPRRPKIWRSIKRKAFFSASRKRWLFVIMLFLLSCILCLTLAEIIAVTGGGAGFTTGIGFEASPTKMPTIVSSGITLGGAGGVLLNIIVANTPQTIVSFMNVLYNSIFTCMLLGEEWIDFAYRRQPLRVTAPSGEQQSNYYLTIPYRYAIPIIIVSGTLHWLVSESLFLVRITAANRDELLDDFVSSIGYLSLAIALSGLVFLVMLLCIVFKSQQLYRPGIPLVGSCSAAISAVCHPPKGKENISLGRVQWGVVRGAGESLGSWRNGDDDDGHCSFSSQLVTPPIPGRWYAGEIQ